MAKRGPTCETQLPHEFISCVFFLGDVFQVIKSLAAMASLPTMAFTIVVYSVYDISMTCRLSMSFVLTELMTKHAKEERC